MSYTFTLGATLFTYQSTGVINNLRRKDQQFWVNQMVDQKKSESLRQPFSVAFDTNNLTQRKDVDHKSITSNPQHSHDRRCCKLSARRLDAKERIPVTISIVETSIVIGALDVILSLLDVFQGHNLLTGTKPNQRAAYGERTPVFIDLSLFGNA